MIALRTLKARIVVSAGAVLLTALVFTAVAVDHQVRRISIDQLDEQLKAEAEALSNLLHLDGTHVALDVDADTLRTFSSKREDAFFQIVTQDGIVQRSESLKALDAELPRPDEDRLEPFRDLKRRRVDHETVERGPRGDRVRMATLIIASGMIRGGEELAPVAIKQPIAVEVARTFEVPNRAREEVLEALTYALPLALLLGVLGVFLVALRSLRPIERMSFEADSIGRGESTARLEVEQLEGELKTLGTTLNGAFDRLEDAVTRERRFSADVAHELRTPLAVLRSRVELALQRVRTPEDYQAALSSALASCHRVERVANDLLLLSRAEAGPPRADAVDLRVVVAHALESLDAVDPKATAHVAVDLPDREVDFTGNDPLLERMAANLIENALRHGGQGVEVHLNVESGAPVLRVVDRGPGFPPQFVERAFDRFTRGDTSRSRNTGGAGLGLAIARAIARAHGGDAEARNRDGGGAEVIVRLPPRGP